MVVDGCQHVFQPRRRFRKRTLEVHRNDLPRILGFVNHVNTPAAFPRILHLASSAFVAELVKIHVIHVANRNVFDLFQRADGGLLPKVTKHCVVVHRRVLLHEKT